MSSIRPTKFAHVLYRTRRFAQMLRWYETVFDAKVQYQNPASDFLVRQIREPVSPIRGSIAS